MTALIAVLWAVIGCVVALALGMFVAPVFGFPDMEGSAAIFGVLIAGPLGAIGGAFIGPALARQFAGEDEHKRALFAKGTGIAIVAILACGVIVQMIGAGDEISESGAKIGYEIRLPAGMRAPENKSDVRIAFRSGKETQQASMYDGLWRRQDGDRDVIRGVIEFWQVAPERTIAMQIGQGPTHLFKLRIPPRPKNSPGFYEAWFPVDQIDEGKGPRAPNADEISEIRHFVTVND